MGADYLGITYAALVAAGGTLGYVKSGSIPSLAAGLVFGGILGIGAYQTSQNPNNYMLSLGTSSALALLMGARFYNSGKFMPAGLITTMSLLMVCRLAARAVGLTQCQNKKPTQREAEGEERERIEVSSGGVGDELPENATTGKGRNDSEVQAPLGGRITASVSPLHDDHRPIASLDLPRNDQSDDVLQSPRPIETPNQLQPMTSPNF